MTVPRELPIGVGRVPRWWMEATPHDILDVDEAETRREIESQMAIYYMQMAAADEAGLVGPDGRPLIGPDGKPVAWSDLEWSRRTHRHNSFNIVDFYKAVLNGEKLPPGFFEKMQEVFGLRSANGHGKYANQADKFEPTWAKKKLRTTGHGEKIRIGIDDLDGGTYKETLRRLPGSDNPLYDPPRRTSAPGKKLVRKTRKVRRSRKSQSADNPPHSGPDVRKRNSAGPPGSTHGGTKKIPKGKPGSTRDERKKRTTGPPQSGPAVKKNSDIWSPPGSDPFASKSPVRHRTSFTRSPEKQRTSFTRSPEKQRTGLTGPSKSVPRTHFDATSSSPYKNNQTKPMAYNYKAKQPEPEPDYYEEKSYEESYEEEFYDGEYEYHEEEIASDDDIDLFIDEIVVDEEFIDDEELSYEEEVVSDDDDLVDLQAFLAEKHAELARLQSELHI
jgi:hypothetical protein